MLQKKRISESVDKRFEAEEESEEKAAMVVYRVRFPRDEMETFRRYLKRHNQSLSAGVRMAVSREMERLGLK